MGDKTSIKRVSSKHLHCIENRYIIEAMKKSSSVTTIRLTEDARRLLWRLGETLGISRTAVIELAIRRMAAEEEIEARPVEVMDEV